MVKQIAIARHLRLEICYSMLILLFEHCGVQFHAQNHKNQVNCGSRKGNILLIVDSFPDQLTTYKK